jgi:hypothetical protein
MPHRPPRKKSVYHRIHMSAAFIVAAVGFWFQLDGWSYFLFVALLAAVCGGELTLRTIQTIVQAYFDRRTPQ